MKSTLIVFHSRTGHTASVAEAIGKGLTAETERLREIRPPSYMRAGLSALLGRSVDLENPVASPGDYDLVVLGTPVWSMSLPPPMRSYVAAHAGEFRNVAFFCTEGGSGGQRVFGQMAKLCGKSPLETLEITEAELKSGASTAKVKAFVEKLSETSKASEASQA